MVAADPAPFHSACFVRERHAEIDVDLVNTFIDVTICVNARR